MSDFDPATQKLIDDFDVHAKKRCAELLSASTNQPMQAIRESAFCLGYKAGAIDLSASIRQVKKRDKQCGSQGIDSDGHCKRCGLIPDEDTECPLGFLVGVADSSEDQERLAEQCCDEFHGELGTFQDFIEDRRRRWREFAKFLWALGARPRSDTQATARKET